MNKLMELVDDYGILRYRLACIGERNRASLAAMADERKAEIRAAVAELERDAARYRWLRGEVDGTALPLAQVVWKLNGNRESHNWTNMADGWSLDEHIDAAMEADK